MLGAATTGKGDYQERRWPEMANTNDGGRRGVTNFRSDARKEWQPLGRAKLRVAFASARNLDHKGWQRLVLKIATTRNGNGYERERL